MTTWLRRIIILIACSAWLSGCSSISKVVNLTPGPSNPILFQDDFSNPNSGWSVLKDQNRIVYNQGGFLINILEPGYSYWSTPRLNFSDVRIDVDSTKIEGPDNNSLGILCRYQDEENFMSLVISSDGYFGIAKTSAGKQSILGANGMQYSDKINQGNASNHLRADCAGNQFSLWVNGVLLETLEYQGFQKGDVGLIASSIHDPQVKVSFDNFIVQKP